MSSTLLHNVSYPDAPGTIQPTGACRAPHSFTTIAPSDLHAAVDLSYTRRGRNTTTTNYGSNALEPYGTRVGDSDTRLLQGVRQNVLLAEAHGGCQLLPDLWIEAALHYHVIHDAESGRTNYLNPFVLLRWGTAFQRLRY